MRVVLRLGAAAGSVLLAGLLAGCPMTASGGTGECDTDRDCVTSVCARDHLCYPASSVREVRVTWTVRGMVANSQTCAGSQDLQIAFYNNNAGDDALGFAPVPCMIGQFLIDKLPTSYTEVELGRQGSFPDRKSIGSTNVVEFDLR
ncbi:MAG: hypothetical protein H0T89_35035 [Deltaproteobacteria bacterium]|nr:hypothetical protein [Deltaproteobacteria bacterium]MDQ3298170.1 hypothetical protein [Myxococcota bacterium]